MGWVGEWGRAQGVKMYFHLLLLFSIVLLLLHVTRMAELVNNPDRS